MNTLRPEDSLLLIIDVQERLVGMLEKRNVVYKAKALLEGANILNIPVIITEQYPKGLGMTEIYLREVYTDNDFVFEKTAFSAMREDGFQEKLKSYGKKQVVVCGIETHVCVHQTVTDLLDNGYEVFVVRDACASRKKDDFITGIELMQQNGAKITGLETTLFEWIKTAKHPNFKEIQALIK